MLDLIIMRRCPQCGVLSDYMYIKEERMCCGCGDDIAEDDPVYQIESNVLMPDLLSKLMQTIKGIDKIDDHLTMKRMLLDLMQTIECASNDLSKKAEQDELIAEHNNDVGESGQ